MREKSQKPLPSNQEIGDVLKKRISLENFLKGRPVIETLEHMSSQIAEYMKSDEYKERLTNGLDFLSDRILQLKIWIRFAQERIRELNRNIHNFSGDPHQLLLERKKIVRHSSEVLLRAENFMNLREGEISPSEFEENLIQEYIKNKKIGREDFTYKDFLFSYGDRLGDMVFRLDQYLEVARSQQLRSSTKPKIVRLFSDSAPLSSDDLAGSSPATGTKTEKSEVNEEASSPDVLIVKGVSQKVEDQGVIAARDFLKKLLAGLGEKE